MKIQIRLLSVLLALALVLPVLPVRAAEPAPTLGDFDGRGTVIAMIDKGFRLDHDVFAAAPAEARLSRADVSALFPAERYYSEKIPYAYSYGDKSAEVSVNSFGTAGASIAAGFFDGGPDVVAEDGTTTHVDSFRGAAPQAQLLLMKASEADDDLLEPDCAAQAILDAVALEADVIVLHWSLRWISPALKVAVRTAERAGIPIFTGAGVLAEPTPLETLTPGDALVEALCELAALDGVYVFAAARDPFAGVNYFTVNADPSRPVPDYLTDNDLADLPDLTNVEVTFSDTCEQYLGQSFARFMSGGTYEAVAVPGVGAPEDYAGLNVRGKLALVSRGSITFTEKTKNAAAAGAIGVIVYNNDREALTLALEDAAIPAVAISQAAGEALAAQAEAGTLRLTFHKNPPDRLENCAFGFTPDGRSSVAYLAAADRQPVAASGTTSGYATATGSAFAAARAGGLYACAKQYAEERELLTTPGMTRVAGTAARETVLAILNGACEPVEAPFFACGAGFLSTDRPLPSLLVSAPSPVTIARTGNATYRVEMTVTNPTAAAIRVECTADVFVPEIDGEGFLTGRLEPVSDAAEVRFGDSRRDLTAETVSFTLRGLQSMKVSFSTVLPDELVSELGATWENGFFPQTRLTFAAAGETQDVTFTAFIGAWSERPVSGPLVYGADSPDDAGAVLYAYEYDASLNRFNPSYIGTEYRYEYDPGVFDEALNVVSPDLFLNGDGWVSLEVAAVREIEYAEQRVYDADGKLLYEELLDFGFRPSLIDGLVEIALWDFIAEDFDGYVWPDGRYRSEITLHAAGGGEQTYVCNLILDSVKPEIGAVEWKTVEGRELVTVTVSDNEAIWDVYATDMSTVFAADAYVPCVPELTVTIDVTDRDPKSPLYIELIDYAGNYKVARIEK